ncbi:hypothetical protein [Thioalkalivibrio sp. ALMg3]|uniref:hypothetical protein n=1 Tax=Thioalkalivibrio sp. ALMg3 TaxID=1158163 RepID=UPI00037DBF7A|nr:hypothetical protein [Thioalkalivibrio sp. ALMg3]
MNQAEELEQQLREDSARMFADADAGQRYYIHRPPQFPPIESFARFQEMHDAIVEAATRKMSGAVEDPDLTTRDKALASQIEAINLTGSLKALQAAGDPRWTILDKRVENLKRGAAIAMEILKQRGGCNA